MIIKRSSGFDSGNKDQKQVQNEQESIIIQHETGISEADIDLREFLGKVGFQWE